jgi:hypothetical protein
LARSFGPFVEIAMTAFMRDCSEAGRIENEECRMNKSLIILALSSMIAACAAQPAAAPVAAEKPVAKPQGAKLVCEDFEEESTGTRLGTKRECKTVPAKEGSEPTS